MEFAPWTGNETPYCPSMQPHEFAQKWRTLAPRLTERAAYQEHWRDLCALLGEPTPSSDLTGDDYAFEKHVKKAGTGETGFADVFKRDHFIVEYKAAGKSLGKALQQALLYARELGNPPLLVVSDLQTIEIHTNFTASSPRKISITLDDLERDAPVGGDLTALSALRALFRDPGKLDPRGLRERVTQDATARIGQVAQALTARGLPQTQAAHFLMRVVFAMFAEDVGLLERGLLTRVLRRAREHPERSQGYFQELFTAMQSGGEFWGMDIRHFNGGLFDDGLALALTREDADALLSAATLDWANVEPAIFGTLFEQSLDEGTRNRRGAHYTGVRDILKVTDPVILAPLREEWAHVKREVEAGGARRKGKAAAIGLLRTFQDRLAQVRVLDPACGSGNFLVVTLGQLLDLEHEVRSLAFELGAGPFDLTPKVHPRQLLGIEVEPFAHELASVSVWIAYFQWKAAHGGAWETPVLQRLDSIRHGDALLEEGRPAVWPEVDFIVGNPPFIGNTRMRQRLGHPYVERLRAAYAGQVPDKADFVTYWIEKSRAAIQAGRARRAGLIVTNSVRGGASARVLERVLETGGIFMAWPDIPWIQDGAAVRVSVIGFDDGRETRRTLSYLEGPGEDQPVTREVSTIHADLTAGLDLRRARKLPENAGRSFEGVKPAGKFDVPADVARSWLDLPNPTGVSNRDVLKPYISGEDLTEPEGKDRWLIDFNQMPLEQARQYRRPMQHVEEHVRPVRATNNRPAIRERWWIHGEARPGLRAAIAPLSRFIATTIHATHRAFVWLTPDCIPNNALTVIAAEDDFTFGVLNSRLHVGWGERLGSSLGVGNDSRYTATTTFATFPFPRPTPEQQAAVEQAARYLEAARTHLRGQQDPGRRPGVRLGLTAMYNLLEAYRAGGEEGAPGVATLADAHDLLDQAVAAAYGWEWPLPEEEMLARLLALNLERAGETP